jgi:hypothetical protein
MLKKIILSSGAAAMLLLTGCSQHIGNFTALSTDSYNPANINEKHKVASGIENDVMSLMILGIPVGGITKLDQAVSETARANGGDFLRNAQVHHKAWSLILVGQQGFMIKGDVYNTQE